MNSQIIIKLEFSYLLCIWEIGYYFCIDCN